MKFEEDVFEREICEADSALMKENVAVSARPIQATIRIFQRHHMSGPLIGSRNRDCTFPVTAANLSNHVHKWYSLQYANKVKIDPTQGRFPLLLEGSAYQCVLPLLFGSFSIIAAKGTFSGDRIVNAVDYVTDLTTYVRERLSPDQEGLIQSMFVTGLEVASEFRRIQSDLTRSAASDALISCDLICGYRPNFSQSAWHSLQFAEKCLKEFISRFRKPPHIHNIKKLSGLAAESGYARDSKLQLEMFDLGASTRYEPNQISINQAVSINHEAWRLAYNVLKQL